MSNPVENEKARAVWFGVVDIMILLILVGFICSMFLMDGRTNQQNDNSQDCLVFSVSVQSPYHETLFRQEGGGASVSLRVADGTTAFGSLYLAENGIFYVECDLSAVDASEDREGIWMLGDTVLMSGALLNVESELADFSVTILSVPVIAPSGNFTPEIVSSHHETT